MKRTQRSDDETSSEMEVDQTDEAKNDAEMELVEDPQPDENEDEEEDEPQLPQAPTERSEFLDAFYGLASTNARERAVAGHQILHHSVTGPSANVQDAAYAWKRLLNGVCSGRAAARQGNASALTSVLKHASNNGLLMRVLQDTPTQQKQQQLEQQQPTSLRAQVRQRLLQATFLNDDKSGGRGGGGRKKAAEVKDHFFGRLFGVLAMVRSGILQPLEEEEDAQDSIQTCQSLVQDLHELYQFKPFMREPAAHAVCMLLNALADDNNNSNNNKVAAHVIQHSIVPLFLEKGDSQGEGKSSKGDIVSFLSAEQVALALNIQFLARSNKDDKSIKHACKKSLLKSPILTLDSLPVLATALANTHNVNPSRSHLVWDTMWLYLTQTATSEAATNLDTRILAESLSGEDSARSIVEGLVEHVIVRQLLGAESSDKKDETKASKAVSIERKTLALTLVRNLMGVEFVSSLTGRTVVSLDQPESTSIVLSDTVIRSLFLNIIGAGSSGKKNQGDHRLKPYAMETLQRCVQASSHSFSSRLGMAKALVTCSAQFDAKTKTTTVQSLLELNPSRNNAEGKDGVVSKEQQDMWQSFIDFVEGRILQVKDENDTENNSEDSTSASDEENDKNGKEGITLYEAEVLVDLLFKLCKRIIRIDPNIEDASIVKFRESALHKIFSFLFVTGFVQPTMSDDKENNASEYSSSAAVSTARMIKSIVPQGLQKVSIARLFSLISEEVSAASSSARESAQASSREIVMFQPLLHLMEECRNVQEHGFVIILPSDGNEEDDEDNEQGPVEIVSEFLSNAKKTIKGLKGFPSTEDRFAVSMGMLASFLHLCLMSSNDSDEQFGEMSTLNEDNEAEEISALIEEAKDCSDSLLGSDKSESDGLSRLVALCINLLSWEPGESRGASKHLVRDIVKGIMNNGLSSLAKSSKTVQIDQKVANMMLQALGILSDQDENEESEEDEDDDDSLDQNDAFTRPEAMSLSDEDSDEQESEQQQTNDSDSSENKEKEEDVLIDNDRLSSLLQEDADMDVDQAELEHHEGADGALAMFIRRKQEARKAGQVSLEKIELSRQLRCLAVLETVVNGRPESWGSLLRCDILMSMVPSLLERIGKLEKSGSKTKTSDTNSNEKNALVKALTTFVKAKLLKCKMWSMTWTEGISHDDHCDQVIQQIMDMSQHASASDEHKSRCYQAIPTLLRCTSSFEARIKSASQLFSAAVVDWSTKKSTRINSHLFSELIQKDSALAQVILVEPLCQAIQVARVRFLKSESFRLLSDMYNPNINKGSNEQEIQALENLLNKREDFIEAAVSALADEEMLKAKGIKEIVQTIETIVGFESPHVSAKPPLPEEQLSKLEDSLKSVSEKTESDPSKKLCDALLAKIEEWKQSSPSADNEKSPSAGKKKKKKSKKKKR